MTQYNMKTINVNVQEHQELLEDCRGRVFCHYRKNLCAKCTGATQGYMDKICWRCLYIVQVKFAEMTPTNYTLIMSWGYI